MAGDLARLDLRPGDRAVLMVPQRLTPERIENLRKVWENLWVGTPAPPRCIVLDDGVRLGVIRTRREVGFQDERREAEKRIHDRYATLVCNAALPGGAA